MSDEEQKKDSEPKTCPITPAPEDEAAKLSRERDDYLAGWQRAKADFVNYKKEEAERLQGAVRYGAEDLMYELITVIDNFSLAVQAMEKNGDVEKGVYLIKTQLEDLLRKRGLERIDAPPGTPFDPKVHEALAEVEAEGPPGTVADTIEPGYRLHDKVLRPVRVRLKKAKDTTQTNH
ncbi:MAG: nucleotide exchange factor GrpE [Patescibacteria group bacterium]